MSGLIRARDHVVVSIDRTSENHIASVGVGEVLVHVRACVKFQYIVGYFVG